MTASAIKKMKAKIAELKKKLTRQTERTKGLQWAKDQVIEERNKLQREINSATLEVKRAKTSLDDLSRQLEAEGRRVYLKLREIEALETGFRQFIAVQITAPDHRLSLYKAYDLDN